MITIHRHALLPYRDQQLFELVNDVESYPEYMDGCVGARVLRREGDEVDARLDLSRGGISQSFSTRNRLFAPEAITLELLDGPFEHFQGRWEFRALSPSACKVNLLIEFRARNPLLGAAASRLFDRVTNNLVDALGRRARQIFGQAS